MDINFWIITTDFVGKVCLAIMALLVHHKIQDEKKIDMKVLKQLKLEQVIGLASILLFVISYGLGLSL